MSIIRTPRSNSAKMTRPHHLHISAGSDHCGNCAWYHPSTTSTMSGKCAMFGGYIVTSNEVCDSWQAGKPGSKGK